MSVNLRKSFRRLYVENLESRLLLAALINGDFETRDFTGWTTYTTENGSIGTPIVEVGGYQPNTPDYAAKFNVGEKVWLKEGAGGGIYQSFESDGPVEISADIFVKASNGENQAAGLYRMLVDGEEVARHDFGDIADYATESATLHATVELQAGRHEVRFEMTRPFLRGDLKTPFQFIDNVEVEELNTPPTANDDSINLDESTQVDIDVLANDFDIDGNLIASPVSIASGPTHGTVSQNEDGTLHYQPNAGFSGVDSFAYTITDSNGASDTAVVNISIKSVVDGRLISGNGKASVSINLQSNGQTSITLLSTDGLNHQGDSFDVAAIDLALLQVSSDGNTINVAGTQLRDVDHDGDLDLVLHLATEDLAKVLSNESVQLTLNVEFGGAAVGPDYRAYIPVEVRSPGKKK